VKIIDWIADRVIASIAKAEQKVQDNFMELLRNDSDRLVNHLYPQMAGMPEAYCLYSGEVVMLNAEKGDRDVLHMLARKVVEHLRDSLLNTTPT
jgi:hypothetical protein